MIIHNPILTGSFTVNGTDVASITSSAASITALNSYTASQNILNGTYATTGSNTFAGIQTVNSNLVVTGSITAQTLVVQTVSSSVIYSSGSNVFGNDLANTQVLTGSVTITGSLADNGSNVVLSNQTSSMSVATASFASTASYWSGSITNSLSSSFSDITNTVWTPSGTANRILFQAAGGAFSSTTTDSNFQWTSASSTLSVGSLSILSSGRLQSSIDNTNNISLHDGTLGIIKISNAGIDRIIINRNPNTIVLSGSLDITNNGATGSLQGTASYALTASYAANAGGGISSISIADEGILQGSASYFDFLGAGVSTIVNAGTASFTITGGGSSGTAGLTTTFTQSVAATTWSFAHNLNTRFPLVQVYDTSYNQVQPQFVSSSDATTVIIGFGIATAGYAVASMGGTLIITGSNVIFDQPTAAATWSFAHNLNTQYPVFQVFDTNNEVIIPTTIKAVDSASALIYFPTPVAGKAVAVLGGISGSGGSGAGFPFSGSAVITGSFLVSGSFVDFTQAANFTGSLTGSLLGTASYATTASYAMFALTASTAPGYTVQFTQSVAAATWSFNHNMNTRNPIVQVYDSTYKQIIPNDIVGVNGNTAEIRFDYATTGYVVMSNGGGLYVTGSTSLLSQTSAATTWSFAHNLNSKYVNFEVYDSNDYVIIPAGIRVIDSNNSELHFAGATAGKAVANFSGINGAPNATTASYALTATSASFASTASYLNPIQSSYVILSQVSASLNYADDTAAAAGGVPLGGLYRNGNFILIRIS